jgi:cytochrome c2
MNKILIRTILIVLLLGAIASTASAFDKGSLVRKKCIVCHSAENGKLARIEELRTTPEEWTVIVDRMHRLYEMRIKTGEMAILLKELCATQILTPDEAAQVAYINLFNNPQTIETPSGDDEQQLFTTCVRCHSAAKIYSYRMTESAWQKLRDFHIYIDPAILAKMREMHWRIEADTTLKRLAKKLPYDHAWTAPEAKPEGEIYVATDALIHEILGPNPPLNTTDEEIEEETFKLFRRTFFPKLITSWTNYPIRRYQRNRASGEIELITGYENAICMLKEGKTTLSEKDRKHVQIWKVENDSATGLGVEYHGHEVKSVNIGGLVLYRTEEMKAENIWVTGIIRRFNQVGRSRLSMGLKRLPPAAHTGKLVNLDGDDKDSKLILMYPDNALLNSEATLIAPPNTFNPGAEFIVSLDNGREFKIRAIKTVQINPVLEQFTFEQMPD